MKWAVIIVLFAVVPCAAADTRDTPRPEETAEASEIRSENGQPSDQSAGIRFGDGRHGSRPARQAVKRTGRNQLVTEDTPGSQQSEGDPDRPIVTGQVSNAPQHEATHTVQQREDSSPVDE